jgi:hypothetical protein
VPVIGRAPASSQLSCFFGCEKTFFSHLSQNLRIFKTNNLGLISSGRMAAIQSPAQSALLAAAGVAPPPPIIVGTATVPNLVAATEYKRNLKRQKLQDVPPATSGDLANAKVQ